MKRLVNNSGGTFARLLRATAAASPELAELIRTGIGLFADSGVIEAGCRTAIGQRPTRQPPQWPFRRPLGEPPRCLTFIWTGLGLPEGCLLDGAVAETERARFGVATIHQWRH